MASVRDEGLGFAIRLTRAELRRLEELGRLTGRTPAGVVRALIAAHSPRDAAALECLKRVRKFYQPLETEERADADE